MFAEYFNHWLGNLRPGARLLEVGCARSEWLPYFAKRYPIGVAGLDYSEPGCAAEREILRRADVDGQIFDADLFDPPAEALSAFDVVLSLGVAEHFEDTQGCIAAIGRLAKPGGIVITTVPNMTGAVGLLQRMMNPAVFAIHVPLTAAQLADAHRGAGLDVVSSGYLMSTNFGVVNLHGVPDARSTRLRAAALLQLTRLSKGVWSFEDRFGGLRATRAFSPYAACCARR